MERRMVTYGMKCPKCGYTYRVKLLMKCEVERCPICGYKAKFEEFVMEVKDG